ncbi:MAG: DUF2125 domain-containing protein [Rubritepida sp.]|jgi:hypothetical protein|nr:DUF2125 domain-containing protein [Rubritepida sp.]
MAGKWWRWPALALLLAAGGVTGAWFTATARMAGALDAWAEARRAEGWRVEHGPPARAGLPLAAELRIPDLLVETPAGLGWQAERATLRLGLDAPGEARLHLAGAQAARHPGGAAPVEAEGLALAVPLAGGPARLAAARLAAPGLVLEALSGTVAPEALSLAAATLRTPALPPLAEVLLAARLQPLPMTTAAAWRAAGGQLDLTRLSARSGAATAELSGRFRLDAALQPEGQGALRIGNAPAAVTALTEAGIIPPAVAPALRAAIAFSARPPPEGGPPRLELPLELRNRRLGAPRLPLLTLPELDWR